jgi:hypothetical protein
MLSGFSDSRSHCNIDTMLCTGSDTLHLAHGKLCFGTSAAKLEFSDQQCHLPTALHPTAAARRSFLMAASAKGRSGLRGPHTVIPTKTASQTIDTAETFDRGER